MFNKSIVSKGNTTFHSFSKHHSLHYEKKLIAFPYGTKHFHLFEAVLCSAHMEFGNGTDKFLYINLFKWFFQLHAVTQ